MSNEPIRPLRSYRVHLVPPGTSPEQIEPLADQRLLRELRLRAPSSQWAERSAHHLTGLPVARVERIEDEATA